MKKLLLSFVVLVFVACSNEKPVDKKSTVFVEQQLNDFIAGNADWVVEEKEAVITDKFKRQTIKWSNEPDFLKGMPLQLKRITDTTESGQPVKIAHFKAFNDKKRPAESLLNYTQLQSKASYLMSRRPS